LFHQLFQSFQCLHLFDHLNCLHVSFIVSFILFRHFSIVSIHSFNHFICWSFFNCFNSMRSELDVVEFILDC
jgi:hypothetical protein